MGVLQVGLGKLRGGMGRGKGEGGRVLDEGEGCSSWGEGVGVVLGSWFGRASLLWRWGCDGGRLGLDVSVYVVRNV